MGSVGLLIMLVFDNLIDRFWSREDINIFSFFLLFASLDLFLVCWL